jgi:hypothetical protein
MVIYIDICSEDHIDCLAAVDSRAVQGDRRYIGNVGTVITPSEGRMRLEERHHTDQYSSFLEANLTRNLAEPRS